MSTQFDRYVEKLQSRGMFTEDPEGMYSKDTETILKRKIFYVQLDGHQLTLPYWTEPTTKSVIRYIREDLKDYPDAMILKTEYVK